jgi:hypothetical protein
VAAAINNTSRVNGKTRSKTTSPRVAANGSDFMRSPAAIGGEEGGLAGGDGERTSGACSTVGPRAVVGRRRAAAGAQKWRVIGRRPNKRGAQLEHFGGFKK